MKNLRIRIININQKDNTTLKVQLHFSLQLFYMFIRHNQNFEYTGTQYLTRLKVQSFEGTRFIIIFLYTSVFMPFSTLEVYINYSPPLRSKWAHMFHGRWCECTSTGNVVRAGKLLEDENVAKWLPAAVCVRASHSGLILGMTVFALSDWHAGKFIGVCAKSAACALCFVCESASYFSSLAFPFRMARPGAMHRNEKESSAKN